jgi:mRNA interferase YafQ
MYHIRPTKKFLKSLVRLKRGGIKSSVLMEIERVITLLATSSKLDASYRDHQLQGELAMYRECHIKGDLLLVYTIHEKELILILVDIGSHIQLFG